MVNGTANVKQFVNLNNYIKSLIMKVLFTGLFIALTASSVAQDGLQIGASVSTSFQLNSHRGKATKIWSSESGYGFAVGMPIKYWTQEERAINTGAEYEFIAFDNWANGVFVSSTRLHAIHVPINYQVKLVSSWSATFGSGLDFLFRSVNVNPSNTLSIGNSINPVQPYLSLGVNSMSEGGSGFFELGLQMRYHFLDLWKKSYFLYDVTSSKIISMDLLMRFYF